MKAGSTVAMLVLLTAFNSCGGTPAPTSPAVGNWYRLDHSSPDRGATVRWAAGGGVWVTGSLCQADATNVFTLAFIREDGAEWASMPRPYQFCGMDFTGGITFGPTASQDLFTYWAGGHRVDGVVLIGREPLTTPPTRTSIGGVRWDNVVARFDVPLDWTVVR